MTYDSYLEKPYEDAVKREERFDSAEKQAHADLWCELQDELEAEKMIDAHEPDMLLAEIIKAVAIGEKTGDKVGAYLAIFHRIDDLVWKEAKKIAMKYL